MFWVEFCTYDYELVIPNDEYASYSEALFWALAGIGEGYKTFVIKSAS